MITNTNSLILLAAAKRLGIATKILNKGKIRIKLTKGKKYHIVHKRGYNLNSHQAITLTHNKSKTLELLHRYGLPIPPQETQNFPLVIKPVSGQKGQRVYLNITNKDQLRSALHQLRKLRIPTLIQPFIKGKDLRFFVLNNHVIGITHRQPPQITGNGQLSIRGLILQENYRRVRLTQTSGRRMLNRLHHWPRIRWYLTLQGLSLQTILPLKKTITLYPLSNFSTGGSAHALTKNQVHSSLIRLAEKAVKLTGLTVAGVDMIVKDWLKSATPNNAYILEINSDPSLRLHDWPNTGQTQKVSEKLLKFIFAAS